MEDYSDLSKAINKRIEREQQFQKALSDAYSRSSERMKADYIEGQAKHEANPNFTVVRKSYQIF